MRDFSQEQREGARTLLVGGLELTKGDTLLLLCQEDLHDVANCIAAEGSKLGVDVLRRAFSRTDFLGPDPPASLHPQVLTSAGTPRAVALAMEWSEETTAARLALLRLLQSKTGLWRIASMPGLTLDKLPLCRGDLDEIETRARSVFAILARHDDAIIDTPNPEGENDRLKVPIRRYRPIISTGRIEEGSWGNFPSGETFIVPAPLNSAEGFVTLRGSFPGRPLREGEWVRFEVMRGRMKARSIQASSPELAETFSRLFFTRAMRAKGKNTNSLAELGIGLNNGIDILTGNPLFDEKKLGSIHLGFGRNSQFDGPLESSVHHDLVLTCANLRVGNHEVVAKGVYRLLESEAIPPLSMFTARRLKGIMLSPTSTVSWKYRARFKDTSAEFRIRYDTFRGPVWLRIATGQDAEVANKIVNQAASSSKKLSPKEINGSDKEYIARILNGLLGYGVLRTG